MFDNLVESSNNSSNTKFPTILRQIIVLNGNLLNPKDNISGLKKNKDSLSDRP